MAESAPRTAARRFAMLLAVQQHDMEDDPAKVAEQWTTWEHEVEISEKLTGSKREDEVKVSVCFF